MSLKDIPEYDGKMSTYNYLRWHGYKYGITTVEEMYCRYYDIKEKPKCIYCGGICRFISFNKGYLKHCDSDQCTKKSIYYGNTIIKTNHRQEYRKYILEHLDFYKNVSFPFIDPYDNQIVRSLRHFNMKSAKFDEIFNVEHICIFCKKPYYQSKFENERYHCLSRSCSNIEKIRFLEKYLKYKDLLPFDIFKLNLKKNKVSNEILLKIYSKYGHDKTINFLKGHMAFFNGYILKRNYQKNKFSYMKNNIIEDDMISYCKNCGQKYIKFDKLIDDNGTITIKKVGAEFSCGKRKCYDACIKLYERSEELRIRQSNTIKNNIKNGKFTPCVTNTWTNREHLKFDNIAFRSTWEVYFYCFNKVNNIRILYEKIRIQYYDSILNKNRIYITDFYLPDKHEVIEIKPSALEDKQNFLDKSKAAITYCNNHNLSYAIIDDVWYKNNFSMKYINILPDNLKKLLLRLLEQFRTNYEN